MSPFFYKDQPIVSAAETHPEQYNHPLCGKAVNVVFDGVLLESGTVERVVNTRFGQLAILTGSVRGYSLTSCEEIVSSNGKS